jgi:hypothetical protein
MITNHRQYLNTQAQAERLQQVADALRLRVREVFMLEQA